MRRRSPSLLRLLDEAAAQTTAYAANQQLCEDAAARIRRLEEALLAVRAENNRALRQFTNVSNRLIETACKILDERYARPRAEVAWWDAPADPGRKRR